MTPSCTIVPRKPILYQPPTFAELWADSRRYHATLRSWELATNYLKGVVWQFRLHPNGASQLVTRHFPTVHHLWIENFSVSPSP
jgi:hypothetical protein